jgi:hypothetical protein
MFNQQTCTVDIFTYKLKIERTMISNIVFKSYSDIKSENLFTILKLIESYLAKSIHELNNNWFILLLLVKQLIILNYELIHADKLENLARSILIDLICKFDFVTKQWSFNDNDFIFLECVSDLQDFLFIEDINNFSSNFSPFF